MCQALLLGQAQGACGVEALHERDRAPGHEHRGADVAEPADVVERKVAELAGGLAVPVPGLDAPQEARPPVRHERALGTAGAPRRVDHRDGIRRLDPGAGASRSARSASDVGVDELRVRHRQACQRPRRAVTTSVRRTCRADPPGARPAPWSVGVEHAEQQLRLAVLQHVGQLGDRVLGVQADPDRADAGAREEHEEALRHAGSRAGRRRSPRLTPAASSAAAQRSTSSRSSR